MKEVKIISLQDTDYKDYYMDQDGNAYSTKRDSIYKLKPQKNSVTGYDSVYVGGDKRFEYVHRLQGNAFLGLDLNNPKMQMNHINKIRDDNRLSNLEVVTPKENVLHAHGHKDYKSK